MRYIHSNLFGWPTVKHAGSTSAYFDWFDWWTNQMYFALHDISPGHMSHVPLCLIMEKMNERSYFDVVSFVKSNKKLRPITWRVNKVVSGLRFETFKHRFVFVLDLRRPFRSRCFGTCHFCIKTSPHGYKLHAIGRKLQGLKLRYSVISYLSYLSYHSFHILDDLPKSGISYFLFITVLSAVRIRTLQSPELLSCIQDHWCFLWEKN